jgi:amino acid transporter
VVQIYSASLVLTSVAAYVVWIESPIRAMFADVPEHTFPKFLTVRDANDSLSNALWTQSGVVIILIAIPLLGIASIDGFFRLLTDLSALSLVIPYIILATAFLVFRLKGAQGPFTMLKSNKLAIVVASITVLVSVAGFFGAGLDYYVDVDTDAEATKAILMTYGGPLVLIALGYGLTYFTKKFSGK